MSLGKGVSLWTGYEEACLSDDQKAEKDPARSGRSGCPPCP